VSENRIEIIHDAACNLGAPVTLGDKRFQLRVSDFDDRKLCGDEKAIK